MASWRVHITQGRTATGLSELSPTIKSQHITFRFTSGQQSCQCGTVSAAYVAAAAVTIFITSLERHLRLQSLSCSAQNWIPPFFCIRCIGGSLNCNIVMSFSVFLVTAVSSLFRHLSLLFPNLLSSFAWRPLCSVYTLCV